MLFRSKHNQAAPCPRCKKMVTHKSRGRMGHIYHQESVQVLQSLENGEILIRLLKVYCSYRKKDVPDITISEATRIFVRQNEEGKLISEPYCNFWQYRNDLTPWKPGYYPVMHVYRRNFYAEVTAHLYCRNLDEVLDGTAWKYAQLKRFYLDDREAIEVVPFLSYYLHHPKLEMLIKLGFGSIATDLIYRSHFSLCLHEEKRKAHEILGVEADDIPFLRDCKINLRGLHTYQKYVEVKLRDRNKLFLWQLEHEIAGDDTFMTALQYISVHKLIRYLDEQYAYMSKRKINGVGRNNGMHFVLRTYDDYLRMCEKEKYDMSNTFILFPKDLRISHDRVSARIKLKADIETRRQFMEVYREITSQMDFERYGLKIVCPQKPEDIIKEGHVLRHCVGSYIERIANRSCFILFLRQQKNPQKPYYTVEVKEGKVSQVRGGQNSDPTKDVERFIKAWERRGLYSAAVAAA